MVIRKLSLRGGSFTTGYLYKILIANNFTPNTRHFPSYCDRRGLFSSLIIMYFCLSFPAQGNEYTVKLDDHNIIII